MFTRGKDKFKGRYVLQRKENGVYKNIGIPKMTSGFLVHIYTYIYEIVQDFLVLKIVYLNLINKVSLIKNTSALD